MSNYLNRLTLSPTGTTASCSSEKSKFSPTRLYHWSYQFTDGSRLEGKVKGRLDQDGNTIINPTQIDADYLDQNGTIVHSWKGQDFACFESSLTGENLVIVASNDNFVGNSLCLVASPTRARASVTDGGYPEMAESFHPNAWILKTKPATINVPTWEVDCKVTPLYPFVSVSLKWHSSTPNRAYYWTFYPYFSPFPLMGVSKKLSS